MAYTAIDIRNEQRLAFDAQYNLAKANGKSDDEAIAIANDARDTIGAQLYQQIATGVIEPVNPYVNNNIYPPESPLYVKLLDISIVPTVASTTTGTVIDKINNNLVHECGQNYYVRKAVELASGVARTIILGIREGIKAALKALGITPGFGGLSDIIKAIKNLVEDITYYINLVNDFVNDVVLVIAKIQALIAFILSLPAQLLKLFKDCLNAAYAEIKRNIFQAIDELGDIDDGGITSDVTALLDSTKKLTSATSELLQAPSKIIGSVSSSSTLTQEEKNSVLSGLFPGSSQYDSNSYSGRI